MAQTIDNVEWRYRSLLIWYTTTEDQGPKAHGYAFPSTKCINPWTPTVLMFHPLPLSLSGDFMPIPYELHQSQHPPDFPFRDQTPRPPAPPRSCLFEENKRTALIPSRKGAETKVSPLCVRRKERGLSLSWRDRCTCTAEEEIDSSTYTTSMVKGIDKDGAGD